MKDALIKAGSESAPEAASAMTVQLARSDIAVAEAAAPGGAGTPSRFKAFLRAIPQVTAFAGGVVAIIWFGCVAKEAAILGLVLAFCLATYLLSRYPEILEFKAFGIEFKQAEKAKEAAQVAAKQAAATVDQLRSVAATLGRLALDSTVMSGRLGVDATPTELQKLRGDVVRTLEIAGCAPQEVCEATSLMDRLCRFDYVGRITELAGELIGWPEPFKEQAKSLKGLDKDGNFLPGQERFSAAEPSRVREVLAQNEIVDPRVLRRLREYERFVKEGVAPDTADDSEELAAVKRERMGPPILSSEPT